MNSFLPTPTAHVVLYHHQHRHLRYKIRAIEIIHIYFKLKLAGATISIVVV